MYSSLSANNVPEAEDGILKEAEIIDGKEKEIGDRHSAARHRME